jgi:hypothetical protein
MQVFVAGATGQTGKQLVAVLRARGINVVAGVRVSLCIDIASPLSWFIDAFSLSLKCMFCRRAVCNLLTCVIKTLGGQAGYISQTAKHVQCRAKACVRSTLMHTFVSKQEKRESARSTDAHICVFHWPVGPARAWCACL